MYKSGTVKFFPNTVYKKLNESRAARKEDGEGALHVFREKEQLEQTFKIEKYQPKAVKGVSASQALTVYKDNTEKGNYKHEILKFYALALSNKDIWTDANSQWVISSNAKQYRDIYGTDEQDEGKKIFKVVEDMFNIIDWITTLAYEDISYILNANEAIEEILINAGVIHDKEQDNKAKETKLCEYLKLRLKDL